MLRDGAQTKILSCNQDLKMVKIQTSRGLEQISNTCRSLTDLNKILRNKNKLYTVQSLRTKRDIVEEIPHQDQICFGRLMTKVRMQQDELLTALQRKYREKEKEVEQKSLSLLHSASQQNSSQVSIYDYLQLIGCEEELKICKAFGVSSENNKEDVQDLVECLRHLANISEPIKGPSKTSETKHSLADIAKYRVFFEELARERSKSDDHTLDWFQILNDQKKCPLNGKYFLMAIESLKKYWKVTAYHPRKRVLLETEGLFSSMEVFARDQAKEQRFLREGLREEEYWQKLCYLFAKGPAQYYLIQYHLKYRYEDKLLEHFNKVTQGQESTFQPSAMLLARDPYYREFVMLLECKYLNHCLRNEDLPEEKLVYIALREISLLMLKNESYSFQLEYLNKAATKLLNQLKTALASHKHSDKIQKLLEGLYSLSQFSNVFYLLFRTSEISTYQYLFLLALLFQGDIPHSKLLLYEPLKTELAFKNIITKIVSQIKSFDTEEYLSMLSCILPAFSTQEKSFIINIITLNRFFFEYLMQFVGFPSLAQRFSLGIEDVSPMFRICMERHSNYSYCLQLGITSCISLLELSKLVSEEKNETKTTFGQQRLLKNHKKCSQIENKDLNLLIGAPQRFMLKREERFSILVDCMKTLIETNICLIRDSKKQQQTYEELSSINELYQQLAIDKVSKHIIASLQPKDEAISSTYETCIKDHKDMLILSFSMIRIKTSIFNRNFQAIVELLNLLFIQISDNFIKTITRLQSLPIAFETKEVFLFFIGDIIQSLLFLQAEKPKVIDRNKIILRHVCKEIHLLLNNLHLHQSQSSILFKRLQGIMTSLSHFPKER